MALEERRRASGPPNRCRAQRLRPLRKSCRPPRSLGSGSDSRRARRARSSNLIAGDDDAGRRLIDRARWVHGLYGLAYRTVANILTTNSRCPASRRRARRRRGRNRRPTKSNEREARTSERDAVNHGTVGSLDGRPMLLVLDGKCEQHVARPAFPVGVTGIDVDDSADDRGPAVVEEAPFRRSGSRARYRKPICG